MRVPKLLPILALIAAAIATALFSRKIMQSPDVLRVGFPLSLLRQDAQLLDPANTDSVYQYYLLENLAVGLVRDSSQASSGYEPGLAESWERTAPNCWVFRLRPGLSWSDGSPIEPAEIAAFVEGLSRGEHRHIVYLKKLTRATHSDGTLTLEFSEPVNDGLIHELSLADTALLRHDTISGGWRAVSGPYAVEDYQPGKRLLLKKNPHFQGRTGFPAHVELVGFTMDTIADLFTSNRIDLLKIPAPVFRAANRKVLASAPQVMKGYPTWIYYFYFNPRKDLWRDAKAREAFALLAQHALGDSTLFNLVRDHQLIPDGYSGHLDTAQETLWRPSDRLKGLKLKVNLLPSFAEADSLRDALRATFKMSGVSIEFGSAWNLEPGDDADVQLTQFAGNQRDAMGSWQFMFSSDHGDLAAFRKDAEPFFKRIMEADGKDGREAVLRELHAHVLRNAYAVPLFIEADMMAAGKRVDLSRLNPFDMRLRFDDVQWK